MRLRIPFLVPTHVPRTVCMMGALVLAVFACTDTPTSSESVEGLRASSSRDDDGGFDDEEGTGFDPGGTRVAQMNAIFGWVNARRQHPDYVEDNGILECRGCHQIDWVGYNNFSPGCVTCHEPEFCGTPGAEDVGVCRGGEPVISPGTALHAAFVDRIRFWSEQHQDVVEEVGVQQCQACHDLNSGGKSSPSTFVPPGCLTCHGPEWLDDDDEDDDDDDDDHEDDDEDDDDDEGR